MTGSNDKEVIEIWKAVIGVQMHFNDISMRIRSMFVTILLALFASLGFLLDKKLGLSVGNYYVQFAAVLPLFGILGTYLFYFIDRYWYHRLLVGSVKQGLTIERKYQSQFPELSLTDAIGKESPYEPRGLTKLLAKIIVSDQKFSSTGMLHSDGKIEFFYKSVMVALLGTTFLVAAFGGVTQKVVAIEKSIVLAEEPKNVAIKNNAHNEIEKNSDLANKSAPSQSETLKSSEVGGKKLPSETNPNSFETEVSSPSRQPAEAHDQHHKK